MGKVIQPVVVIGVAIIALAILAVIVKKGGSAPAVIKSITDVIASSIKSATGPLNGV